MKRYIQYYRDEDKIDYDRILSEEIEVNKTIYDEQYYCIEFVDTKCPEYSRVLWYFDYDEDLRNKIYNKIIESIDSPSLVLKDENGNIIKYL